MQYGAPSAQQRRNTDMAIDPWVLGNPWVWVVSFKRMEVGR